MKANYEGRLHITGLRRVANLTSDVQSGGPRPHKQKILCEAALPCRAKVATGARSFQEVPKPYRQPEVHDRGLQINPRGRFDQYPPKKAFVDLKDRRGVYTSRASPSRLFCVPAAAVAWWSRVFPLPPLLWNRPRPSRTGLLRKITGSAQSAACRSRRLRIIAGRVARCPVGRIQGGGSVASQGGHRFSGRRCGD